MKLVVDRFQPRSRELVLTGNANDVTVVVLAPIFQLEDYFKRGDMHIEEARQIAVVNLATIARAAAQFPMLDLQADRVLGIRSSSNPLRRFSWIQSHEYELLPRVTKSR